ncbi:hypothetical protein [Phaeodactylibacter sp.]|uniref:hypothetical protein n=1 Tax=Phaeodactylibacter sp. TaxID=1940289 RepID=UPI0025D5BF55|nr:hypothetical protein [Phaeodactylibacter sp.]MCI5091194.1 hypothetical protein [Phaeodactylibacter sp.]
MANLKKPSKSMMRKGLPPKEDEASNNLAEVVTNEKTKEKPNTQLTKVVKEEIRPLNFKVPNSFRKRFKNYAVNNDVTMSELLVKCFEHYETNLKKQESR